MLMISFGAWINMLFANIVFARPPVVANAPSPQAWRMEVLSTCGEDRANPLGPVNRTQNHIKT